jgi:hypothetical protein
MLNKQKQFKEEVIKTWSRTKISVQKRNKTLKYIIQNGTEPADTFHIIVCQKVSVGSAPPFVDHTWNVQPNGKTHEVTENCNIVYTI